jgi:hypothetical protein
MAVVVVVQETAKLDMARHQIPKHFYIDPIDVQQLLPNERHCVVQKNRRIERRGGGRGEERGGLR